MSQVQRSGTNHLLAWVRTEISEQQRILVVLAEQEASISGGTPAEVESTTARVSEALTSQTDRRKRLEKILMRVAKDLGVPASTMTLGSAAERLGGGPDAMGARDASADQLWRMRAELRDIVKQVTDYNRRIASLIGLQRGIVRDVLSALLSDENGDPIQSEGSLIDASA
ncbi:MAG: hypothetical protein ACI8QZ_000090 [Chlamydiales bacterium]